MNFFITNLFVGVVVSAYNREKEKKGSYFLMTGEQKEWYKTKILVIQAKPKYFLKKPKQSWRYIFYKISVSQKFEYIVLVLIGINTLLLACVWNE